MTRTVFARFSRWWLLAAVLVIVVAVGFGVSVRAQSGNFNQRLIATGAGTTMLLGGTGAPRYIPVLTKVAFFAEVVNGVVKGSFECLALAPPAPAGPESGDFNTNIMYVTGSITSAEVDGDTMKLSGTSECTGIGAGSNVPFTAIIRKGGPGARLTLTTRPPNDPPLVFEEILVEGGFDIRPLALTVGQTNQ